MHHTPFSRSSTFDPDRLKTLGQAFDGAWACIANNYSGISRDTARCELAKLIMEFAADRSCSHVELTRRAIGAMRLPPSA